MYRNREDEHLTPPRGRACRGDAPSLAAHGAAGPAAFGPRASRAAAALCGALVAAGLASGCASVVGTRLVRGDEEALLRKQASFDLGCPRPQIELSVIGANDKSMGAVGCGKRTSYLYVFGAGWGRNSEVLAR